jgi:hypothetical protein
MKRREAIVIGLMAVLWAGCEAEKPGPAKVSDGGNGAAGQVSADDPSPPEGGKWISLVPEDGMGAWETVVYGGEGEVAWSGGVLRMEAGADLTGVRWTGDLPEVPYEIELEARKTSGYDFFGGLTVPANREGDCVTLIVGGWGGGVVGISSIDGMDAAENETASYREFESNRWYPIRMVLRDQSLEAWVEGKQVVDLVTKGRKLGLRAGAIEESAPLGLSCFQTTAEVRAIRWRNLPP